MKTEKTPRCINLTSTTVVISFKDRAGDIIMERTLEIAVPSRVADRLAKVETSVEVIEARYELHTVLTRDKDMEITRYINPN